MLFFEFCQAIFLTAIFLTAIFLQKRLFLMQEVNPGLNPGLAACPKFQKVFQNQT
jgi:hypothetical protein